MIVLADNDQILKLGCCGLLNEALVVLQTTYQEVYVLPTAPFMIKNNRKKFARQYSEEGINRTLEFISRVQILDIEIDPQEQQALLNIKDLDVGEVTLLVASKGFPDCCIATGDKRFLTAFAREPICAPYRDRLRGKFICFEQVILRIMRHYEFDTLKEKIIPARSCDKALMAAFGSGIYAEMKNVLITIGAYIDDIDKISPFLLFRE